MRVAGFDLSLTRTGIAIPGRVYSVALRGKGSARLSELRTAVYHAAQDIDLAVLEAVVPGPNALSGQALAGAHAVAKLALHDLGVPWFEVWPVHLHQWATGSGKATKDEMLSLARAASPLTPIPDHDAADAFWLYTVGCHAVGNRVLGTKARYAAVLAKVWIPDGTRRRMRVGASA